MLSKIVQKNRSYRRFDSSVAIPLETLINLVELARLCPSSRNQQAIRFMVLNRPEDSELVYPSLAWAGYLPDWNGPVPEERPVAYIVILGDNNLGGKFETDLGIVAQTMMLGAVEAGFGGCMIASIRREDLRNRLKIPDNLEILLVLALGSPVEEVIIEPVVDNNIRYWRDNQQVHNVPKRDLEDLLVSHIIF